MNVFTINNMNLWYGENVLEIQAVNRSFGKKRVLKSVDLKLPTNWRKA